MSLIFGLVHVWHAFADIIASAVLSGNRNFEGRVHALTRANYLASPPLVVAYALAGTVWVYLIEFQNLFGHILQEPSEFLEHKNFLWKKWPELCYVECAFIYYFGCYLSTCWFVCQVDIDFENEPIGVGKDGKDVYFRDIWPSTQEVADVSTHEISLSYINIRCLESC